MLKLKWCLMLTFAYFFQNFCWSCGMMRNYPCHVYTYIYILHTYIFWQVQSWSCPPNVQYIFWSLLDYTYEISINSIRNYSILLNHITSFIMKQLCPAPTLRMWVWHSPRQPRSRNRRTCPQIVYYDSCWIYHHISIQIWNHHTKYSIQLNIQQII